MDILTRRCPQRHHVRVVKVVVTFASIFSLASLGWISLAAVEAPMLNRLTGMEDNHPPAYFKALTLNVLEQRIAGECREPAEVRFTGPEINMVHYIWVTTEPGCNVKLRDGYNCALESALKWLPGIPITIWIVQPPTLFVEAKNWTSWRACSRDGHIAVQTREGKRNVTTRPIVVADDTTLGMWYSDPENALFLWTFKPRGVPMAEISDFFRIFVLQQHGGLYMDFDYVLISPQVRFIEDGAGREFGPKDSRRFGGHAVANSFLKFSKGSRAIHDIAADMLKRIADRFNPHDFSYIGMGSVTRTYLEDRFRKGCSHMNWTGYGRQTVFKNACEDFQNGIMIGMHMKMWRRRNDTCIGAVQAYQLSCPLMLSAWDATYGHIRL
eukprot:TRINITY_DN69606_c0_g1_i1.p1 TRINITY_DN69606_c0_g1~~TRINITY_DN69606_c0_g1_i1.p1  ORF type:complete len:382 (-),score=22.49 TRINITY_DN69606_c0_g1_i1:497-1642(-)